MICEHTGCIRTVTIECADCWPWRGFCDAHIDSHAHDVDGADAALSLAEGAARDAEQAV